MIGCDELSVDMKAPFREDLAIQSLKLLSVITGKPIGELMELSPSELLELSCFGSLQ